MRNLTPSSKKFQKRERALSPSHQPVRHQILHLLQDGVGLIAHFIPRLLQAPHTRTIDPFVYKERNVRFSLYFSFHRTEDSPLRISMTPWKLFMYRSCWHSLKILRSLSIRSFSLTSEREVRQISVCKYEMRPVTICAVIHSEIRLKESIIAKR